MFFWNCIKCSYNGGVPERVCCYFRIIDADGSKALLDNLGDGGLEDAAMLPASHEIDEQRTLHVEVIRPERQVVLQRRHHLIRDGNDIMFINPALALDVQHVLSIQGIEVADVDAGHLAGTQTIGEHQLDHQIVSGSNNPVPIYRSKKVITLLTGEGMFIVFLGTEAGLDSRSDVIVVSHCRAVLIEYLDDGDVTVDCEDGLTLLLEFLLVTQHISPAGCPGIDTLSRQPAEPEVNLPPVI